MLNGQLAHLLLFDLFLGGFERGQRCFDHQQAVVRVLRFELGRLQVRRQRVRLRELVQIVSVSGLILDFKKCSKMKYN